MDEKWPEAGTVSVAEPFRSSQPIAACLRDTENWVQRRYSAPHRLSRHSETGHIAALR